MKTTPDNLVEELIVDIKELKLGQSVRVKDIQFSEGMEVMSSLNIPVASVGTPRALKSLEAEEAEAAAAEGEEGAEGRRRSRRQRRSIVQNQYCFIRIKKEAWVFFHASFCYFAAMQDLNVTTVQANLAWEDKTTNLKHFDELLHPLKGTTDLVVLPEMFTTGFSMNAAALAETMDDPSVEWMVKKAAQLKAVVTGSLIIKENDQFFNRLIWMFPDGHFQYYDKRHLFTLAREHLTYTAGQLEVSSRLQRVENLSIGLLRSSFSCLE